MDKLTPEQRRKTMKSIKAKGSKIEVALATALFSRGHRYRKNNRTVFGTPDLTFKSLKIAIFVDSEFWHGKDWDIRKNDHRSNVDFWHVKIQKNIDRDILVNRRLKKEGWTVLRFWGQEIKKNIGHCVAIIEDAKNKAKLDALHKKS